MDCCVGSLEGQEWKQGASKEASVVVRDEGGPGLTWRLGGEEKQFEERFC